jgi:hypothetical protein
MRALAESETTRFRAIVDRQRDDARIGQEESRATVITRTEEWKKTALMRAQQLRQSSSPPATLTRLVMTMCGSTSGRWNPKAQWQWRPEDDPRKTKDKTKHHITADTLYRYLRAQQLFS